MHKDIISKVLDKLQEESSDALRESTASAEKSISSQATNHFDRCVFNFNGDIHINCGLDPYDPMLYSQDNIPLYEQMKRNAMRKGDFKIVQHCMNMILELEDNTDRL